MRLAYALGIFTRQFAFGIPEMAIRITAQSIANPNDRYLMVS